MTGRNFSLACLRWSLLAGALAAGALQAQLRTAPEYEIKAAFLLNFIRYVQWPESAFAGADSPFVIGIFGADPFGPTLERTVRGRPSKGREIVVRRLTDGSEIKDCCHLIFISSQENREAELIEAVAGRPVLTIGETEGFLRKGGDISLLREGESIAYYLNLDSTAAVRLEIQTPLARSASELIGPITEQTAAFLLNFTRYVRWPEDSFADPEAPLVVGILGFDPFGTLLESTFRGRSAQGRSVAFRHLRSVADLEAPIEPVAEDPGGEGSSGRAVDERPSCHLVFISRWDQDQEESLLATLEGRSTLTVSENRDFVHKGGIIELITDSGRVRFKVNRIAAAAARLTISSRMLHLAVSIHPPPRSPSE